MSCQVFGLFDGPNLRAVLPVSGDGRKASLLKSVPTAINDSFMAITGDPNRTLEESAVAIAAVIDMRGGRPLLLDSVDPTLLSIVRRIDPRCQSLVIRWDTSPRLELPTDWDEYLSQRSSKQRQKLRRLVRLANQENACFRFVDEADAVAESTRLSLAQRRRVWSDHGLYDETSPMQKEQKWDAFLVAAARSLARSELALSGELVMDGKVVAAALYLRRQARLLGYHRSAERSQMGFGTIFDALVIRAAIERGVRVLDFGRGSEKYKYQLGVVDTARCDVVVGHVSTASLLTIVTRIMPNLVRGFVQSRK